MYISNSKKFLFIAIPKTGCSSIQYMISNFEFGKDNSNTFIWNHKIPEIYHATLEDIMHNIDTVESLGFSVLNLKTESFSDFNQFGDYYYTNANHLQVQLTQLLCIFKLEPMMLLQPRWFLMKMAKSALGLLHHNVR